MKGASLIESVVEFLSGGNFSFASVLLILAACSAKLTKIIWSAEKDIENKNIEKIKVLTEGFKVQSIEPFLRKHIKKCMDEACAEAIDHVFSRFFKKNKSNKYESRNQDIDIESIKNRLYRKGDNKLNAFFSSASGTRILDDLHSNYERIIGFSNIHNICIYSLRNSWIIFALITIGLLTGLLEIIFDLSEIYKSFWQFAITVGCLFSCVYLLKFEYHRRKLLSIWKRYQIYNKF